MNNIEYVDHKAETADLVVNYLRTGSGPPLVLLHGWPEFSRSYKKNISVLAKKFDVIVPDLRGFGDTRRKDQEVQDKTTPALLTTDLAALLDVLRVERVGIVSHDVGALVAQKFARDTSERVAGLFFFNCPYPGVGNRWDEGPYLREAFYQYFHQWPLAEELVGYNRDTCRLYLSHFLRHWSGNPDAFAADIDLWVETFMKPGNLAGGFAWYRGALETRLKWMKAGAPKLAAIGCPARVLWGERDPVCPPAWGDRLGEYFSNLKFTIAPDAGHFVHYEQPALANEEILKFFAPLARGNAWA